MPVIAHLSDLHLTRPPFPGGARFGVKRLLGYASWKLRRRHHHQADVFRALLRDPPFATADHVVATGDLTFLGMAEEIEEAASWLDRAGGSGRVTVVPGNHDACTPGWIGAVLRHWGPFLGDPVDPQLPFPRRRSLGDVVLFGISTAVPSGLLAATGAAGGDQVAALRRALREAGGRFRIVALHHPPRDGVVMRRRRLVDAASLRAALAEGGAELVLHGHAHRTVLGELQAAGRAVPCVGARSGTERRPGHERIAEYHLYGIRSDGDGWRVSLERRRYVPGSGAFAARERREWTVPPA